MKKKHWGTSTLPSQCVCSRGSCSWWAPDGYVGRPLGFLTCEQAASRSRVAAPLLSSSFTLFSHSPSSWKWYMTLPFLSQIQHFQAFSLLFFYNLASIQFIQMQSFSLFVHWEVDDDDSHDLWWTEYIKTNLCSFLYCSCCSCLRFSWKCIKLPSMWLKPF